MSNFNCDICGLPIIENDNGVYITACEHYPLDYTNNPNYEIKTTFFKFPIIEIRGSK